MAADNRRRLGRLPAEETKEIVVRLPADDLAPYKLVCKDWCRLISSPGFVSEHLERSKSDPSSHRILVHDDIERLEGSADPGPFKSVICFWSPYAVIVGSINGLICMVGNYRNGVTSPDDIWIFNPVTGNASKLPPPASSIDVRSYDTVTYAFWWDSDSIITSGASKSSSACARAWESSSDVGEFSKPVDSNSSEAL